ncbi:MAG: thiopurine S-methyltransferase [Gammaproteobacteria bacterium]|nr:thiopurine S-methyltransferase [Gammaproteobacteria bacterium]MBT8093301.1 thiopurine S-methyltransferase [Gammaproteobacteria bacterium]MBT8106140.1 thiopurine S-methyltransferase [Gammaproteobacteria bacterium]NNK26154.1 thiopurine S-methyltransferase [Woeseiaceae bacterium]
MNEDWLERWQIGRIGWHEPEGNRNLQRHWTLTGRRVLVPLCGKTPDLLWLEARGNEVVGVELSEIAVVGFFEENDIPCERIDGDLVEYRATDRNISLFCGDYFAIDAGSFDAHYDRGALVAMPPALRPRYAEHTSSLLSDDAMQFVIAIEYDHEGCVGPPFSLPGPDLLALWPGLREHARIDDTRNAPPKFLEAGLQRLHEVVWITDDEVGG